QIGLRRQQRLSDPADDAQRLDRSLAVDPVAHAVVVRERLVGAALSVRPVVELQRQLIAQVEQWRADRPHAPAVFLPEDVVEHAVEIVADVELRDADRLRFFGTTDRFVRTGRAPRGKADTVADETLHCRNPNALPTPSD